VREDQSTFLGRMAGYIYFYAALMVSSPPPSPAAGRGGYVSTGPHPFGLQNAWTWLARLANTEPRPDVTASVLFVVLEVCVSHVTTGLLLLSHFMLCIFVLNVT